MFESHVRYAFSNKRSCLYCSTNKMYLYLSHIGVDRRLRQRRLLGRVQTQYLHFSNRHVVGDVQFLFHSIFKPNFACYSSDIVYIDRANLNFGRSDVPYIKTFILCMINHFDFLQRN